LYKSVEIAGSARSGQ